jgi:membrane associated rhomboid family serine protease
MFPIGDEDPQGRQLPIITWVIIAINVLVFLYELTLSPAGLNQFFEQWGTVPAKVTAAIAHPGAPGSLQALFTLISAQFIHAGWLHIAGNMLFLYVFGDDIEDLLGKVLYPLFYLFCGIVAGLVQTFVLVHFNADPNAPGIGASGAIAGILGAYIVLYPNRRVTVAQVGQGGVGRGSVPALVMLGLWFVQQLLSGVTALQGADTSGVGFWAHIGGFVAGALLILPFRSRARRLIYPGGQSQSPAQYRQYQ